MTAPVLVLHAPTRRARTLMLSADVLLDQDKITISAEVSPQTQAWLAGRGRRALDGLRGRLGAARSALGRYVKLEGDWSKAAGQLGLLGFDVAQRSAQLLLANDDARRAASTHLALQGRLGPQAQAEAQRALSMLRWWAQNGDSEAYNYLWLCDAAASVASGSVPTSAADLETARGLDAVAGACCQACAHGMKCEGEAPNLEVHYDIEEAVLLPEETPERLAGLGRAALGYRAYKKFAPILSVQQVAGAMNKLAPQSHHGLTWIQASSVPPSPVRPPRYYY